MRNTWFINIIGWTAFMLIVLLTTWGSADQLFFGSTEPGLFISQYQIVRMSVFFVTFFVGMGITYLARRPFRPQVALWGSVVGLLCGALALLAFNSVFLQVKALVYLSAALLGVGLAVCFMLWQRVFTASAPHQVGLQIGAATALAIALYSLAQTLPAVWFISILLPLVVVISAVSLLFAVRLGDFSAPLFSHIPRDQKALYVQASKQLFRSILCVASLALIWQLTCAIALSSFALSSFLSTALIVGSFFGALLFIVIWVNFSERIKLGTLYQIAFPVIATGFLLLPFFDGLYAYFFVGLTCLVFGIVSMMMQLTCLKAAQELNVRPGFVVGLFAGCVYGFMFIGHLIGRYLLQLESFGFIQLLVIALIAVYALALVLFVSRERQGRQKTAVTDMPVIKAPVDLLSEQCAGIADKHNLSAREAEILELIVRGRDVPHIAKTLFISENTVRTHNKRIYAKIGIHNKQELLNLLEESQTE